MLWNAMSKTGKGYRRHKLGHTGEHDDRRKDKLREVLDDNGEKRIKTVFVPFLYDESKIERAARHHRIGVRHV